MAVNRSRDMTAELELGLVENSYMRLTPNRGGVIEDDNAERMAWPTYARVETGRPPRPTGYGALPSEASTRGTPTTRSRY